MITCASCDSRFEPLFDEKYQQAYGCSATIYEKNDERFLSGHYGSRVADMRLYKVQPTNDFKLGNCCDDCISKLERRGHLILLYKNGENEWA